MQLSFRALFVNQVYNDKSRILKQFSITIRSRNTSNYEKEICYKVKQNLLQNAKVLVIIK